MFYSFKRYFTFTGHGSTLLALVAADQTLESISYLLCNIEDESYPGEAVFTMCILG